MQFRLDYKKNKLRFTHSLPSINLQPSFFNGIDKDHRQFWLKHNQRIFPETTCKEILERYELVNRLSIIDEGAQSNYRMNGYIGAVRSSCEAHR
jgi:hypothetical protein